MKKVIFFLASAFLINTANSQVSVPKTDAPSALAGFVKPPDIGDVATTTTGITDLLSSQLSVTDAQKPKLTDAISGFLNQKKGILGLADSNPTSYLSKFNPLQKGLFGKLKGILGATGFTKFLGLKPSGNNIAGNLLSNLFF